MPGLARNDRTSFDMELRPAHCFNLVLKDCLRSVHVCH